jgi:hypothetical protein
VSSVDQAVIDLVESVSIWGVPGLEVDSFVLAERTFDRHLPACGKVDQSEVPSALFAGLGKILTNFEVFALESH